jgi:hypothetical protein
MAIESFEWNAPVIDAGDPNPVIAVPGDTPTSPLTVVAVPATLVTVEPARIPKLQAAPNGRATGGGAHAAEVVNVHTKGAARAMPKVSCAPVVIVAVKVVLTARVAVGVKVAILVAAT